MTILTLLILNKRPWSWCNSSSHRTVAGLFPEVLPTGLAYYSEQEAPEAVPDPVTTEPVAGPSKGQPLLLITPDQVRG